MKRILVTGLAGLSLATAALAQQPAAADHDQHHPPGAAARTAADFTDGEVRKVDKEAGKVTLKHGPIRNLDMPPMTMVFKATDPKLLDAVKVGDKVRFVADRRDGGGFTVQAIEPVR
ncbi:copper-binding protein [Ramlibacter sp.]|uniref:copper-binding protein n=1 Tax=Ramlibacter sp. TaxID=1917967 RepID=UPI002D39F4AF|nr:copper-binding protein [Ramlibacter sp.]HYD75688.1 copper-binding protein [Ramlibacter sp.]